MKKILLVLIFTLLPSAVFATAQISDLILYKGESYYLFSEPLESYFKESFSRPDYLFAFKCTACRRGYVASWEVKGDSLYLTKLVEGTCGADAKEIPIAAVFSGQKGPIKADWFSGDLRIPQGKQLEYVHMGYASTYERDLILTIKNGKVIDEKVIDNTLKQTPAVPEKPMK